jgi:hypothetical protein
VIKTEKSSISLELSRKLFEKKSFPLPPNNLTERIRSRETLLELL